MPFYKKPFGQKFVDYLAPKYYNSLPLIVKKNIINNKYNVKKLIYKCSILSLEGNADSIFS